MGEEEINICTEQMSLCNLSSARKKSLKTSFILGNVVLMLTSSCMAQKFVAQLEMYNLIPTDDDNKEHIN